MWTLRAPRSLGATSSCLQPPGGSCGRGHQQGQGRMRGGAPEGRYLPAQQPLPLGARALGKGPGPPGPSSAQGPYGAGGARAPLLECASPRLPKPPGEEAGAGVDLEVAPRVAAARRCWGASCTERAKLSWLLDPKEAE